MLSRYTKNNVITGGNDREIEYRGLSTDEKPVSSDSNLIPNGSVFIEIDTGKMYLYDAENTQWKEI